MNAWHCPECGLPSEVLESREAPYGTRRRRYCVDAVCGTRWTTEERVRHDDPLDAPGPPAEPALDWDGLGARRRALGPAWSMLRLAAMVGCTETTISYIERPKRPHRSYWPAARYWLGYARALDRIEAERARWR